MVAHPDQKAPTPPPARLLSAQDRLAGLLGVVVWWEPTVRAQPAKPVAPALVVGHGSLDKPPELPAVVGPQEVGDLVDKDVIDQVGGRAA